MCFEALKVVLRSFKGVKVDEERGVVVARRGVTDGAIVTLGRVEERRVDAWDWALALSGIFVVVWRRAVLGVQRAFETGRVRYALLRGERQRSGFYRADYDLQRPWFALVRPRGQSQRLARLWLLASVLLAASS